MRNELHPVIDEKFLSNAPLIDDPSTYNDQTKEFKQETTILDDDHDTEEENDYQIMNAKSRTLKTKELEMMISENALRKTHARKTSDPQVPLHTQLVRGTTKNVDKEE